MAVHAPAGDGGEGGGTVPGAKNTGCDPLQEAKSTLEHVTMGHPSILLSGWRHPHTPGLLGGGWWWESQQSSVLGLLMAQM